MLLDPYPYLYFKVTEIQSFLFICVHLYSSSTILVHLHVSSLTFALLLFPNFDHCATSAHLHLDLFEFGWPNVFFIKKGISSSCLRCMGPVQADIPDWHYVRTLLFFEVQNAELFCDQKVYIWKCQRSNQVRD